MPDSSTDKIYIELDALFKRADDVVATSVIGRPKRGSGYIPKVDAKIRLNAEVMAWLKDMGPRHYSRINGLLTALMEIDKGARGDVATDKNAADTDATGMESGSVSTSDVESSSGSESESLGGVDSAVDAAPGAVSQSAEDADIDSDSGTVSGESSRLDVAGRGQAEA